MSNFIRLHEKYGLNPTIPCCFWCGGDRNEVALLGAAYSKEAPRHMLVDYEPCDQCKGKFALGITLIEVKRKPNFENQPSMVNSRPWEDGVYPTGTIAVIKREAVFLSSLEKELHDSIMKKGKAFILSEDWDTLGLPRENKDYRE